MKKLQMALTTGDRMVVKVLISISVVAVLVAMLTSCTRNDDPEPTFEVIVSADSIETHATVTFSFGGDIDIHPMTRTTLSELNLTDVWIFDYIGDNLQTTVHQTSTDTDFGQPSLSMEYGTHTLYFVASRGLDPSVDTDAKTITWGTVRDTFWATLQMTVSPSTATSQSVSLSRVVGRLKISATDVVPATASKFTITPSIWYYGINYQTGDAVTSRTTPINVNIPSSYIGTTNLIVSIYSISDETQWTTAVTAVLKTSDDSTLGSVTITDIPIQRNHITNYGGGIINTGRAMTITIADDEWTEDTPVTW